jgi:hypothetical protein
LRRRIRFSVWKEKKRVRRRRAGLQSARFFPSFRWPAKFSLDTAGIAAQAAALRAPAGGVLYRESSCAHGAA